MTTKKIRWITILFQKCAFLSAVFASLLMDLVFLLIWSITLSGFDRAIDWIDPSQSHRLISAAKIAFELSTLATVVFFTANDIVKIVARICVENRKELYAGKNSDEDKN